MTLNCYKFKFSRNSALARIFGRPRMWRVLSFLVCNEVCLSEELNWLSELSVICTAQSPYNNTLCSMYSSCFEPRDCKIWKICVSQRSNVQFRQQSVALALCASTSITGQMALACSSDNLPFLPLLLEEQLFDQLILRTQISCCHCDILKLECTKFVVCGRHSVNNSTNGTI